MHFCKRLYMFAVVYSICCMQGANNDSYGLKGQKLANLRGRLRFINMWRGAIWRIALLVSTYIHVYLVLCACTCISRNIQALIMLTSCQQYREFKDIESKNRSPSWSSVFTFDHEPCLHAMRLNAIKRITVIKVGLSLRDLVKFNTVKATTFVLRGSSDVLHNRTT